MCLTRVRGGDAARPVHAVDLESAPLLEERGTDSFKEGRKSVKRRARLLCAVSRSQRRRRRQFGYPTQEMDSAGGCGSGGVVHNMEALDGVRIVLKPSESLDDSRFTRIASADFNDPGLDLDVLLGSFVSTGFQAFNLGDAIDVVDQMIGGCRMRSMVKIVMKMNLTLNTENP